MTRAMRSRQDPSEGRRHSLQHLHCTGDTIPPLPKVEQELQRMEENGVIERITEPIDWCAPIVPVMKRGGGVRICVDLKKLNRAVKRERERYMFPTLENVMHKLKGSTVFTMLDATSGFWQLPLDNETAKLTTFMTPFGRYFFRRLPFGFLFGPRSVPENSGEHSR